MELSLNKKSDVPLRQQLAEQIVVLITTGQVEAGEQLPSVRALARRLKIHHNTVSEAYQELVQRGWLTRQRGSRLMVGARNDAGPAGPTGLDELINETIQRAKGLGYNLQALTKRVRERLQEEPPDHVLVVEEEAGLRRVICEEVREETGEMVESCSLAQLAKEPELCFRAQVFAPRHLKSGLKVPGLEGRPPIWITYSMADEHVKLIQRLSSPSAIAAVSVSASLLKAARSFFAPALGRRHAFQDYLVEEGAQIDLRGMDLAFCDSITLKAVQCRRKIRYRLLSPDCLEQLASAVAVSSGER